MCLKGHYFRYFEPTITLNGNLTLLMWLPRLRRNRAASGRQIYKLRTPTWPCARSQNTEPTFQALLRFTINRAFKCILVQLYEDAHFYEKDAEKIEMRPGQPI